MTNTTIAAFDFDGTLTRRDTLGPYLVRYLAWYELAWAILKSAPWLIAHVCKLMSNHHAKARLFYCCFANRSLAQVQGWSQDFVQNYLPTHWRQDTLERLREHQRLGHRCIIISASADIYLTAAAQALNVHQVLCTEMQVASEHLTGHMQTPNCYGEQKALRLKAWMAQNIQGPVTLYAYGDSAGDKELLAMADIAMNVRKPHEPHFRNQKPI